MVHSGAGSKALHLRIVCQRIATRHREAPLVLASCRWLWEPLGYSMVAHITVGSIGSHQVLHIYLRDPKGFEAIHLLKQVNDSVPDKSRVHICTR